jgi:oxygen-independent coproporphyrinogen-3 oxidase
MTQPIGLYLHIPFCEKKCAYCDFNTYAGLQSHFADTVDALCAEMSRWRATLAQALALQPEHLSLYSLIVEPNTPLYHWVETGKVPRPDDDLAADLYEAAIEILSHAGYLHYEVSNWARMCAADQPGQTPHYASQHNLLYWRNQEYLGIGPGAHSHLRLPDEEGQVVGQRWGNRKPVPGYVKRLKAGQPVVEFSEIIDPPLAMGETMMLGLRLLQEGVPFARFRTQHGRELWDVYPADVSRLIETGLLMADDQRVRLTPHGLLLGNQVFAHFLPN